MQIKKPLFLSLGLLLPIIVFLFLKFFGKNQFDVPLLYEDKIPASENCNVIYTVPYVLSDSSMDRIRNKNKSSLYLVSFSISEAISTRIKEESGTGDLTFVNADSSSNLNDRFFRDCILMMKSPNDIVLIDHQKRIRGHYASKSLEEVDRLILEIKIILKQY